MTKVSTQRTALITGSGKNIGRAIAIELAAAGCNIILNGSSDLAACESVASEIESTESDVLIAMGDIGIREQAIAIADRGINRFGRIDILVNNAAIRPSFDLVNDDEADFHRIMDINFHAALWLTRACLPGMIQSGWGRVINFTGMNAQQGYTGTIVGDDEDLTDKYVTLKEQNPTGRLGTTGDIARMVRHLASDDAGFVNGQLLQVNGGVMV